MRLLYTLLLSLLFTGLRAQWSIDPFDSDYFIENIGQYAPVAGKAVVAGVEDEGGEIYYTASGFTYRICKPRAVPSYLVAGRDEEEPENERESHTRLVYDTLRISAEWVGAAGGNMRLEETQSPLFHYAAGAGQLAGARTYSRLIHKNLYAGIDLEYSFHPQEGIKYDLTVHPGGNPDQIALRFGEMDGMFLDSEGNLHVTRDDAALIDHAPSAYLVESGTPVAIRFVLAGSTVRFEIADYDTSQTLLIDPWLINPGFTVDTKVFDIGWDCSGNVYAFGGSSPWKVRKFSSAGVFIWNYNTNHTDWYGDLIVDNVGNVFLIEGCCDGNRQKLDPAGILQWNINNGVYEFWRLAFSCDFSRLTMATAYSAGAAVAPANSMSTVNMLTGALSGQTVVSGSEPRSMTAAANGNYYALTAVGNELVARTGVYGPIYTVGNGYSLLYNGPLYANGANTTSGENGIAVYSTFIFTSNGATLMKRNIATGALISSVAIPGGSSEVYSGISVDNCGNVFVGTNGSVRQYDVNLNPVASFAVSGAVYEVSVSGTAQLLMAGNGFLASENAPCVAPCPTCVILSGGLSAFDVAVNALRQVEVAWTVPNPEQYAEFRVERSADGVEYSGVRLVDSDGPSLVVVDEAPLRGHSWYRLAMHERGGGVSYGPARQVWVEDALRGISVFPNPAGDRVTVSLAGGEDVRGVLQVMNLQGRVVLEREVSGNVVEVDLSGLGDGMYLLRLMGGDFGVVKVVKGGMED